MRRLGGHIQLQLKWRIQLHFNCNWMSTVQLLAQQCITEEIFLLLTEQMPFVISPNCLMRTNMHFVQYYVSTYKHYIARLLSVTK